MNPSRFQVYAVLRSTYFFSVNEFHDVVGVFTTYEEAVKCISSKAEPEHENLWLEKLIDEDNRQEGYVHWSIHCVPFQQSTHL
jgi:hypothetical protein